jgi:pimeloyl-ACP methyl ester carboxylesterase
LHARGIQHDVDDLDAVRRYFGFDTVSLIGHSYAAVTVALYAIEHPEHFDRIVQIGAMQPFLGKQYPPDLQCVDETYAHVMAGIQELDQERASVEPSELCRKFWQLLRVLFLVDPADAGKLAWDPCRCPNEQNFRKEFMENVLPSIQKLNLSARLLGQVKTPVLTIHGTKDRSAPFGGGKDWANLLGNAQLVTVEGAGHFPWVEKPELVFTAIDAFLR